MVRIAVVSRVIQMAGKHAVIPGQAPVDLLTTRGGEQVVILW